MPSRKAQPGLSRVVPPLWSPEVAREMHAHAGRRVALEDGPIVGAADTLDELLDNAEADGYPQPLVLRLSAHPDRVTLHAGPSKRY